MRTIFLLIGAILWQLSVIPSTDAQTYRATFLDHPDGSFDVFAINDAGQIVGNVEIDPNTFHAVRREPSGQFTTFSELGGNASRAFGINELGHVCGFTVDANGGGHVGVWEDNTFRELDLPVGAAFTPFALDLNNEGIATGYFFNANNVPHAVVWDGDGNVQNLPELDGFASVANAINEAGEIAGQITRSGGSYAVLWQPNNNGGYQALDLGTLGGSRAGANDVNNNSEVVGFSFLDNTSGIIHAFLWKDGVMADLGTLGGNNSIASAINDHGDVVGSSQVTSTSSVTAIDYFSGQQQTLKPGFGLKPPDFFLNSGPDDDPWLASQDTSNPGKYTAPQNLNDVSNNAVPSNDAIGINGNGQILTRTFVTTSSTNKHLLEPADRRNNTTSSSSGRNAVTDEPVNLFTGELFSGEPIDLYLGGHLPLFFQRYYASGLLQDGNIQSALGNNWLHNFDWELTRFGESFIEVISNRGRLILFEKVNDVWELRGMADIPFQLTENGQDFILADPRSQLLYTFDSTGKPTQISDGKGNTHTLTYDNGQLTRVNDGLERTLIFAYDGNGRLMSVSDGSRSIEFEYSGDNLTGFTDAEDQVTTYSYDDTRAFPGLLTAKTLPEGNTPFSQTYDESGRVATQTDAGNNTYTFTYAQSKNVAATTHAAGSVGKRTVSRLFAPPQQSIITDPAGNSSSYVHNDGGEATSFTDELGQTVALGYDNLGRRNVITDRLGRTTTFEFHNASGYASAINRADGTSVNMAYSARQVNGINLFDLLSITYPDGSIDNFGYDGDGNLTSFTDPTGANWSLTYNNRGQPLTVTNPEGGVTALTYNGDATLASLQDPAGNTTAYEYDNLKRLIQITRPDGATRSFTYDDRDRILTVTNESGNTTTLAYDGNGNLISFTDPLGNTTTFAYNEQDQIIRASDPLGNTVQVSYDELQRVASVTDRNGSAFNFNYDARGRATAIIDAEGNTFATNYDGENTVTSVSDPLGNTLSFTRDELSRITGITSALGNQTVLTRDIVGRITALQNPLGNATNVTYDNRGLATNMTLATGAASNYNRNGFGQITAASDPNGGNWSFQLDNLGRLSAASDPLGNTPSFDYDSRNRPSRITLPGGLGTLDLGFDGNNNLTTLSYSDGAGMNFTYDANNRPTAAEGLTLAYDANDQITESNGLSVTRDAGGRISSMTLGPGKVVSYAYDRRNLVTTITDWLGGVTSFSYDAAGRLINVERPNGVSASFDYNAENRVVGIVESKNENETLSSISLTRNAFGQITASDRQAPLSPILIAGTITRTYDAASQIEGFDYDGLGRRTDDDQREYTWDLASRLTGYSENGSAVSFTYDALGQRLSRTANGVTQSTVWNYAFDGLPQVSILSENGDDVRYYIHTPDGLLLYSVEAGDDSRRFYHYDETGSTLFLTDDDAGLIAAYAYSPYGELLNSTGDIDNLFTFQGAFGVMREGDAGMFYMRARYYDAKTGQFISRDPIPFLDPRRINPYQYALGDPMRFADPSGLTPTGSGQNALGRFGRDKLWVWGAYGRNEVDLLNISGSDNTLLENIAIRYNGQPISASFIVSSRAGRVLSPAVEEVITVTSESPLLDERKISTGTTVTEAELEKIPTARDPWVILQQTPGVLTDRINVGGNESGQQSNFVSPGTDDDNAVWAVDGVVITDMSAVGAASGFYQLKSLGSGLSVVQNPDDQAFQILMDLFRCILDEPTPNYPSVITSYYGPPAPAITDTQAFATCP